MEFTIEAVNVVMRHVILSDGAVVPIIEFCDEDGDECEPEDAVWAVASDEVHGTFDVAMPDGEGTVH